MQSDLNAIKSDEMVSLLMSRRLLAVAGYRLGGGGLGRQSFLLQRLRRRSQAPGGVLERKEGSCVFHSDTFSDVGQNSDAALAENGMRNSKSLRETEVMCVNSGICMCVEGKGNKTDGVGGIKSGGS